MGELFVTEQMNLRKGLKVFGKPGADAVVKELHQLDQRKTIEPILPKDLTKEQRREALRYLMYCVSLLAWRTCIQTLPAGTTSLQWLISTG